MKDICYQLVKKQI